MLIFLVPGMALPGWPQTHDESTRRLLKRLGVLFSLKALNGTHGYSLDLWPPRAWTRRTSSGDKQVLIDTVAPTPSQTGSQLPLVSQGH